MPLALEVANAFIIVPNPKDSILSACDKMFPFGCYSKCVQFFVRALNGSDDLSIVLFPIGYLTV